MGGKWPAAQRADLRQLRTNVLLDVILTYQPDLVLVDDMPGAPGGNDSGAGNR